MLQLLLFIEKLFEAKDVVYMDLKKASDFVSHYGLLIGITGKLWKWLQEYMLNRIQCVRIGDSLSTICNVLPRECIRTLSVCFILPQHIQFAMPFIFADDTKCQPCSS